jgi:hypothetical protein
MQMNAEPTLIESYWNRWQELALSSVRLLFLRVGDPKEHFDGICGARGPEWTRYIYSAVVSTPYAVARALSFDEVTPTLIQEFSGRVEKMLAQSRVPFLSVLGGSSLSEEGVQPVEAWIFGS